MLREIFSWILGLIFLTLSFGVLPDVFPFVLMILGSLILVPLIPKLLEKVFSIKISVLPRIIVAVLLLVIAMYSSYQIDIGKTERILNEIHVLSQNIKPYQPPGYFLVSKGVRKELPNGLVFFLAIMQKEKSTIAIDMRPKMTISCNNGTSRIVGSYSVCETPGRYIGWNKDTVTIIVSTSDKTVPLSELEKIVHSL